MNTSTQLASSTNLSFEVLSVHLHQQQPLLCGLIVVRRKEVSPVRERGKQRVRLNFEGNKRRGGRYKVTVFFIDHWRHVPDGVICTNHGFCPPYVLPDVLDFAFYGHYDLRLRSPQIRLKTPIPDTEIEHHRRLR